MVRAGIPHRDAVFHSCFTGEMISGFGGNAIQKPAGEKSPQFMNYQNRKQQTKFCSKCRA
jgi:hypothetical protein